MRAGSLKGWCGAVALLLLSACADGPSQRASAQTCTTDPLSNHHLWAPHNIAERSTSIRAFHAPTEEQSRRIRDLMYTGADGTRRNIEDYISQNCVRAILIIKNDSLVLERYAKGLRPDDQYISHSMAKTVAALLVGIAIDDGKLRLDQKISEILPDFRNSAWADDTIEDLLRMSSAANLTNRYDGNTTSNRITNTFISPRVDTRNYLRNLVQRDARPGARHEYNSAITALLAIVLSEVNGQAGAPIWRERVWNPLGAEAHSYFFTNSQGIEGLQCCFSATARDYARLGVLIASRGQQGERQIVGRPYTSRRIS